MTYTKHVLPLTACLLLQAFSGCAGEQPDEVADRSEEGAGELAQQAGGSNASKFSFFVTSLRAMRELSKNAQGFGGDLRFGETGEGAGLRGADKICATIAAESLPAAGSKVWRAFLSTTKGGQNGGPVHAINRIGQGPWYDRLGRIVAMSKSDLLQFRPATADSAIKNDLPNEDGVPNHNPDGTGAVDNHDTLTGSNDKGEVYANDVRYTCNDWTKSAKDAADSPRVGHSWPRLGAGGLPQGGGFPGGGFPQQGGGARRPQAPGGIGGPGGSYGHWISSLNEAGCGAGVSIVEMGGPRENNPTVGSGGGYGGIYCFALTP